jgi:hypothetical protein
MQPRYISSYGGGVKKPVHDKIKMMSETLASVFDSLESSDFLLNCLPDPASRWARDSISSASRRGIIRWGTHGLNTHDITRYDAALILQPFLYQYIAEAELFRLAGIRRNERIPQNFVYDITDAEDIFLLNKLELMLLDNGRFNPNGKISKQAAAVMFTRAARLFGLRDTAGRSLRSADVSEIADWAESYVRFALSMRIMGVDQRNNFNPEEYISYEEFYSALLNIARLKEAHNTRNNIRAPASRYFKVIEQGTLLASDGWVHYYNCPRLYKFTGSARFIFPSGDIYEGEWLNGIFHGKGRVIFTNGAVLEGEFKNGELVNP